MTNEKMLELLKVYMKTNDFANLTKLKDGLEENIRLEIEKSKGTKIKDIAVMKRVWRDVNDGFKDRENLIGYHPFNFNNKEYKGFTDGHYIIATENDFGYPKAKEHLAIDKFFESEEAFSKNDNNIEIKIDLKDLTYFKKTHKRTEHKSYVIENELIKIGFNPWLLSNALDICKVNTIYVTNPKSPALLKSENSSVIALVLPVYLGQ